MSNYVETLFDAQQKIQETINYLYRISSAFYATGNVIMSEDISLRISALEDANRIIRQGVNEAVTAHTSAVDSGTANMINAALAIVQKR